MIPASGEVKIGSHVFTVKELTIEMEIGFGNTIRRLAKKALGPGGFYANARETLEYLNSINQPADRNTLMQVVATLTAQGASVSDDLAYEYRQSPDGVAEELYWRTRDNHPDFSKQEFRAVINDVNALEIHLQIMRAISPKEKTPSQSSGSS